MQIIVAGQVVDYVDEGAGPVLLMVHGWGDRKGTWRAVIEKLRTDFRCVALDLPNFGASAANQSIVDVAGYADALAEFVAKLALLDYTYVGHSMGGQIGMYATAHGTIHPKKLVLVAAAGVRDDKATRRKTLKAGSTVLRRLLPISAKRRIYQAIGSDYDPSLSPTHKVIIDAVLSTDVQQEAARIAVPTLLIYGSDDTATPPEYGRLLHGLIRRSRYEELQGYDHFLHQKAAAKIAESIRAFARETV